MPSSQPALAPINFKTHKLRGEWAELRFMTRAAEHGLMVSKPWGDSAPYDLMVEHHGRVLRIQSLPRESVANRVGQIHRVPSRQLFQMSRSTPTECPIPKTAWTS
jgi:hypothetical protein